jgi:hypothetical protein
MRYLLILSCMVWFCYASAAIVRFRRVLIIGAVAGLVCFVGLIVIRAHADTFAPVKMSSTQTLAQARQ